MKSRRTSNHAQNSLPACSVSPPSSKTSYVGVYVSCVILGLVVWLGLINPSKQVKQSRNTADSFNNAISPSSIVKPQFRPPETLAELLSMRPDDLGKVDIARMNLLCATGLNGSENMNIHEIETTLDRWAVWVRSETRQNLHRFRDNPAAYENSTIYYQMGMLTTVLQQDFKVQYNPARIPIGGLDEPDNIFFADSKDVFLNGLASTRAMGTCSSLPVLYVAIGRRLGYPLKLAAAKAHLFVQWELGENNAHVNIEGSGHGFHIENDAYYRKWPYPMSDDELIMGHYLQPMTPAQELAVFLETRAACLDATNRMVEARQTYAEAAALIPDWPAVKLALIRLSEGKSIQMLPSRDISLRK